MKIPGSITKPVKPVNLVYIHGLYPCNYLSEANHRFPRTLYFYFSVFLKSADYFSFDNNKCVQFLIFLFFLEIFVKKRPEILSRTAAFSAVS